MLYRRAVFRKGHTINTRKFGQKGTNRNFAKPLHAGTKGGKLG
jgi:hypothetical protein